MSYWSHNPEVYDEIIVKELIRRGLVTEEDRCDRGDYEIIHDFYNHPDFHDICVKAEQSYWGDVVDDAVNRMEER